MKLNEDQEATLFVVSFFLWCATLLSGITLLPVAAILHFSSHSKADIVFIIAMSFLAISFIFRAVWKKIS
ncbi:MAG: hypothetical protein NC218_02675 [Acetobacter sp.]|nr:hypothetical protein [Acetobacter sp.]